MAFFWTKDRLFRRSFLRLAYLIAFVCFFILTETGRKVYRPYVYRNHIDDWGVADTIGNSLGTLTQIFFYLGLMNATRVQSYRIIAFVTLGYIAYELVQPILPRGTFDMKDVLATFGAGVVAAVSVAVIHLFFPEKNLERTKASTLTSNST